MSWWSSKLLIAENAVYCRKIPTGSIFHNICPDLMQLIYCYKAKLLAEPIKLLWDCLQYVKSLSLSKYFINTTWSIQSCYPLLILGTDLPILQIGFCTALNFIPARLHKEDYLFCLCDSLTCYTRESLCLSLNEILHTSWIDTCPNSKFCKKLGCMRFLRRQ